MSETSGFFNSEVAPDGTYDRTYMAEQFANYFARFIGNGVFITPSTQCKVEQKDGQSMKVVIDVGDAFINGYWYKNDVKLEKTLSNANGTTSRIDRIVLRWDSSTRSIYSDVLEGTPNSNPVAVDITRNDDVYELALADVVVGASVTEIIDANVTDLRNNNSLCGYVSGLISQIETTSLFSQFTSEFNNWFSNIKNTLNQNQATNLYNKIEELEFKSFILSHDFEDKTTSEDINGNVIELYADGRKIVTSEEDDVITQKYYSSTNVLLITHVVTENEDGSVTETNILPS